MSTFTFLSKPRCPAAREDGRVGPKNCPGRSGMLTAVLLLTMIMLSPGQAFAEKLATKGRASWYGTSAHGKQTASGEIFDRDALTAAHKELPFGTVLRVHNLKNGRSVLVRINDRGPFVKGRVVDVSHRAAEALRMTKAGVVSVSVEVVSDKNGQPLNDNNAFYVHIANESSGFKGKSMASDIEQRLDIPVRSLFSLRGKKPAYAVCAGPYKNFGEAQRDFEKLEQRNMKLLGIIEGPAKGSALPKLPPPGQRQAAADKPAPLSMSQLPVAFPLNMNTSTRLLGLVKNVLPGLTGNTNLFFLPSQPLSGYTNLPS